MKTFGLLFGLFALLLAPMAQAQQQVFSKTFNQSLTGSAPTTATDGVDLADAQGYSVAVSAPSSQTLSGGGSLLCYYYGAVSSGSGGAEPTKRWMRCATTMDISLSGVSSVRDYSSGDFETLVAYGRVKYIPSSVTISSGTTVDVTITVRKRK